MMWWTVDERTDPSLRVSEFDEMQGKEGEYVLDHQDIFGTPMVKPSGSQFIITTPNKANNRATYLSSMSYSGTESVITKDERNYQSRGSTSYLGVSVTSDDKIKVSVGGDKYSINAKILSLLVRSLTPAFQTF